MSLIGNVSKTKILASSRIKNNYVPVFHMLHKLCRPSSVFVSKSMCPTPFLCFNVENHLDVKYIENPIEMLSEQVHEHLLTRQRFHIRYTIT